MTRMLHRLKRVPKASSFDHSILQIPTRGLLKNAVIGDLTRSGFVSIRYFVSYVSKQDSYELNRLLRLCQGSIKSLNKMHAKIIIEGYGQNVFVGSKLISMYSELGQSYMKDARKVFDNLSERDVFLWNSIIQTYANSGLSTEALNVYKEMREHGVVADKYTFPFMLKAVGIMKDDHTGRVIHGHAIKHGFDFDTFVGNALVTLYAKCHLVEACRRVFEEIPEKDLVSWNSIISGYTNNRHFIEAIEFFHTLLHDESISAPDGATLVTILPACAQAAEIRLGFWIHCYTIKTGMEIDAMLGSGLIAMYSNSGRLSCARQMFDQILGRNVMVWTAMMRGYGMHGDADQVFDLYSNFLKHGLRPDGVVFLCLLSTCSHAGLVSKGREIFKQMEEDYGVKRGHEHYACMVDLLGRAGFVTEAADLIKSMPMPPGKDVYGALLGACRMHNNIELAEFVAEKLFVLDPNSGGRYVTLAEIYGSAGRLKEAAAVRKTMVKKNIKKPFGCSSVEVDGVFHAFGADDETRVRTMEIFEALVGLDKAMGEEIRKYKCSKAEPTDEPVELTLNPKAESIGELVEPIEAQSEPTGASVEPNPKAKPTGEPFEPTLNSKSEPTGEPVEPTLKASLPVRRLNQLTLVTRMGQSQLSNSLTRWSKE